MIVIQARMASTRLPGKVLRELGERPVLGWVIRAAQESRLDVPVVVATSDRTSDDPVASLAIELGAEVTRGSEDDVLTRFLMAVEEHDYPTAVIRLTGDNALIDPQIVAAAWRAFTQLDVAYLSTNRPPSLPLGMDVEVADTKALETAHREADGVDRVHVTSYLYRHNSPFKTAGLTFQPPADDLRVTLDTEEDARALDAIVTELGDRPARWHEVVDLLRERPDIVAINADVRQKHLEEG